MIVIISVKKENYNFNLTFYSFNIKRENLSIPLI